MSESKVKYGVVLTTFFSVVLCASLCGSLCNCFYYTEFHRDIFAKISVIRVPLLNL